MVGVEFINKIAGMIPYGSSMSSFLEDINLWEDYWLQQVSLQIFQLHLLLF